MLLPSLAETTLHPLLPLKHSTSTAYVGPAIAWPFGLAGAPGSVTVTLLLVMNTVSFVPFVGKAGEQFASQRTY